MVLSGVEAEVTTIAGDVVDQCGFSATGQGSLDNTPPSVFFRGGLLLADSSFSVWFSELVELQGVDELIDVIDSNGADIRTLPEAVEAEPGFTLSVQGFWPLGENITVNVSPGLEDRAGNRSSKSSAHDYRVVDDPGNLEDFGFEQGDLSGFTLIGTPVEVTASFLGITPTEGDRMATIGSLSPCVPGGVSLTSRFVVPDGVSHLSLDYNLVITPLWASLIDPSARAASPLISGSLRGNGIFREFRQDHPRVEETSELPDGFSETGFRRLDIPVDGLAGQEVVMTLRIMPSIVLAPPPICGAAVLLLDNLRFESRIEGGTLVRLWHDPPALDPHLAHDVVSSTILVEVFGGLVTIDPDIEVVPDLAESWELSPDGTVYTFHLRRDASFHNGDAVTAQDFKWSLERASDPLTASPTAGSYLGDIVGVKEKLSGDAAEIEGVRVIDPHTLEIAIDAPKPYFLAKLTYPAAFVLDKENVESGGRRWFRNPNGTGPFKLAQYIPGESLVLTRNESYHLGPPTLEKVRFILSGGTAMLMYETEEIHIAEVDPADLDRVLDPTNPLNAELHKGPPQFSTDFIGMNVNASPFDDPKVRQALNYAVDKEAIVADVLSGLVVPAKGVLPPGFPGYNPFLEGYPYAPEKARQLLSESKCGANPELCRNIILTTAGSSDPRFHTALEVILDMWRENLGIAAEMQMVASLTFFQDLRKRRFEMFRIGWTADYPYPENFLDPLFHCGSNINFTAYCNPEVDRLLERARVEPDEAARYELYRRAEELIVKDAPWISLWHRDDQYVLIKPYVHDYFLTPLIVPKLRFVYMTEESNHSQTDQMRYNTQPSHALR